MILAIDISQKSVYIALGKMRKGVLELSRASQITIQNGVIVDGVIKDKLALIQAISEYIRAMDIKVSKAAVTITSKVMLTGEFTLPITTQNELTLMVKNEMLQLINNSTQYVIDYVAIEQTGTTAKIAAYAIPTDIVEDIKSILKELKLIPVKLDVHSNCVKRLFSGAKVNDFGVEASPVIFAEIGPVSISSHLFINGKGVIFRTAAANIQELERSLVHLGRFAAGGSHINELDFTPANLENDILLLDSSKRYLAALTEELQRIINYQLSQDSSNPVARIYIYGEVSQIKGISDYLSAILGISVESISAVDRINSPEELPIAIAINCAGALITAKLGAAK